MNPDGTTPYRVGAELWGRVHDPNTPSGWAPFRIGRIERIDAEGTAYVGAKVYGRTSCPLALSRAEIEEWNAAHPLVVPTTSAFGRK